MKSCPHNAPAQRPALAYLASAPSALVAICLTIFAVGCDEGGDTQGLFSDAPDATDATDITDVTAQERDVHDVFVPDDTVVERDVSRDEVSPDATTTTGASAIGRVYVDEDDRAQSAYSQPQPTNLAPIAGLSVTMVSPDGPDRTTTTASDGTYVFDGLVPGRYFVSVEVPDERRCNSNNLARRTPEAISEGALTVVTFGDSLPHYGPTPWFPTVLRSIMAPFATITDDNIAVPGSESPDWLAGGLHHDTLKSHVGAADLVVFSLGGNDLGNFLNNLAGLDPETLIANLDAYLTAFDAKVIEVAGNLQAIAADVHARNPEADIVWIVYVNYAWNDYWKPYLGEYAPIVRDLLATKLEDIRYYMSRVDNLMLVDLFGAIPGEDVAGLMSDELHFNVAGHARCAEELFMLLGGVTVDANANNSRGLSRSFGLAP